MTMSYPIPQTIGQYFDPRIFTESLRAAPLPQTFIGESLLPMKDVPADKIFFEIRPFAAPMAPFVALDAESPRAQVGTGVNFGTADALQIRHKVVFSVSDLRHLRYYGDLSNSLMGSYARAEAERVAEAMKAKNDAIDLRIEWMRVKSMLGRMTVVPDASSPLQIDVQYPVTTQTASPLWSATTTADPLNDIQTWTKNIYGYSYDRLIVTRATMFDLARNTKLLNRLYPQVPNVPTFAGMDEIKRLFMVFAGLTIEEYRTVYTTRTTTDGLTFTDTATAILPDGQALLLPNTSVGYTGTVPQILNNWQTGKYAWVNTPDNNPGMQDPPRFEYGAGWGGMPVLEFPDRIQVLTVA